MAVIKHKSFKGQKTLSGSFVKIAAYDDTAHWLILKYITRGVTNFYKSEGVLCRRWCNLAPNLGIKVAKSSKYLGVIIAYDPLWPKKL
jgi:hypothetical protein